MNSNKKKTIFLSVLVVVFALIVSSMFIINTDNLSKNEKSYLENFYKDSSIISKGKYFDIRYIKYDDKDNINSSIELVKKSNIDMNEVSGNLIFNNGKKLPIFKLGNKNFNLAPMTFMFGENGIAYHYRIYEMCIDYILHDDDVLQNPSDYDFKNLTVELEYNGEKEIYSLNYKESNIKKSLDCFFEFYYKDKIDIDDNTIYCFTSYYQDYIELLEKDGVKYVREFIDKFNLYYVDEKYHEGEFFGLDRLIYDYSNVKNINEFNVNDTLISLQRVVNQTESYINNTSGEELKKITSTMLDILIECGQYESSLRTVEIRRKKDEVTSYNYNLKSDEFWQIVDKYLRE